MDKEMDDGLKRGERAGDVLMPTASPKHRIPHPAGRKGPSQLL